MLIALFSDIHGNFPALKAAAADVKTRGIERIICAGDITGYGPFPNEVCEYLKNNQIESICGNYDRKVLEAVKHGESAVASLQKKKRELVLWTAKTLGKTAQRFLSSLPGSIEEELPNRFRIIVVHGSPVSDDDDIYPSITTAGLKSKIGDKTPDIIVCGHTHIPFVNWVGNILVINCGSIGQPVDGDPMPSYAILSLEKGEANGCIIRFSYDVHEIIEAIKKADIPKGLQKDFAEGTKRRFL